MDQPALRTVSKRSKRKFRLGIRGLLAVVLVAGLVFGFLARQDRQAREQTARLVELRRMGVVVNRPEPTLFCLATMRFFGDSLTTEKKLGRWLDPGWFTRPIGFNAGNLPDDRVQAVVEKLRPFGRVKEVRFDRPPLAGLRLFYVGEIPYGSLGVPKDACTYTDHSKPTDSHPR